MLWLRLVWWVFWRGLLYGGLSGIILGTLFASFAGTIYGVLIGTLMGAALGLLNGISLVATTAFVLSPAFADNAIHQLKHHSSYNLAKGTS